MSDKAFKQWVAAQSNPEPEEPQIMTHDALITLGKQKYDMLCSACHQADGTGIPPLYPALKGSSVAVGHPISRHVDLVLNGVPGTAMQAYREQLTNEEIAAITTYERNAWGNNTNEDIQPNDVAQARKELDRPAIRVKQAHAGGLQ